MNTRKLYKSLYRNSREYQDKKFSRVYKFTKPPWIKSFTFKSKSISKKFKRKIPYVDITLSEGFESPRIGYHRTVRVFPVFRITDPLMSPMAMARTRRDLLVNRLTSILRFIVETNKRSHRNTDRFIYVFLGTSPAYFVPGGVDAYPDPESIINRILEYSIMTRNSYLPLEGNPLHASLNIVQLR